MTWTQALALGSTKLSRILGCPISTAQSWIKGSGPPEWQRPLLLAFIESYTRKEKYTKEMTKP